MKINYASYTEDELLEALEFVDKDKYPDNYQSILENLKKYKVEFENEIKPNFNETELFEWTASEIGQKAEDSGHKQEYAIILAIGVMGAFLFMETRYAIFAFICIAIISSVIYLFSKAKDLDIFEKHNCPICNEQLNFYQKTKNRVQYWYMQCSQCKKTAPTGYSGIQSK